MSREVVKKLSHDTQKLFQEVGTSWNKLSRSCDSFSRKLFQEVGTSCQEVVIHFLENFFKKLEQVVK